MSLPLHPSETLTRL